MKGYHLFISIYYLFVTAVKMVRFWCWCLAPVWRGVGVAVRPISAAAVEKRWLLRAHSKSQERKFLKFAKTETGLEKLSKENLQRRLSRACCYEKGRRKNRWQFVKDDEKQSDSRK